MPDRRLKITTIMYFLARKRYFLHDAFISIRLKFSLLKDKIKINILCSLKCEFSRYNVSWYQAPLHIQKLILFLLRRGSKAFVWNIAGLFIVSIECFASVMLYYTITNLNVAYFVHVI